MSKQPKIRGKQELARSRFLILHEVQFTDERGRERIWDAVDRVGSAGAVVIIPTLAPDGRMILVKQFRPAAGTYLIEFPAGLIDPGEDARIAAERELWEETGYRGAITRVYPPTLNSPGLSGETVTLVEMAVNAADYPEPPGNHQEDSENIETLLVAPEEFAGLSERAELEHWAFDAKVAAYFIALETRRPCGC